MNNDLDETIKSLLLSMRSLTLSSLIAKADRDVLINAIELLGHKVGVESLDDLSIHDWFDKQRVLALEHHLVSVENKDPALAAMMQEHLDDLRREGGITDSE